MVTAKGNDERLHFTYEEPTGALHQGDVIEKNAEVSAVINQVHPHFSDAKYPYFMVLTQSCDLVVRKKEFKAPYITLAAVRPLSALIQRELRKRQQSDLERIANVSAEKNKDRLRQFCDQLLNNNNSDYFYLHHEHELDFHEDCCAFLRLSIALKKERYDVCHSARILSLRSEFQAKLGWLVGNIYSRVGTEDWPKDRIKVEVDRILRDEACEWVDTQKLQTAKREAEKREQIPQTRDELRQFIQRMPVKNRQETILDRVDIVLQKLKIEGLDRGAVATALRKGLQSDNVFVSHTKG